MPTESQTRNYAIDYAKAIGICLVCIGHFLPAGSAVRVFLYSFHVPLFFVLAGTVLGIKQSSNQTLLKKILKLAQRILIPYSVWFWVSAIPAYFLWGTGLNELLQNYFFFNGKTLWNTALWFLPCYFIVMCAFEAVCSACHGNKKMLGISAALAFCAALAFDYFKITECFLGINKSCLMYVMVVIGFLVKETAYSPTTKKSFVGSIVVFSLAGVISCTYHAGDNISIMNVDYNNIYIFTFIAIIMCLAFIKICTILPPCVTTSRLAKNSLFIMSTHLVVRQVVDLLILIGFADLQRIYAYIGIALIPIYIAITYLYGWLAKNKKLLQTMGKWLGLAA